MRVREVAVDAATLAVREWGDAGSPALLFWHSVGPGGTGATVGVAADALAAAGWQVVAPDAPGFGRSAALPAGGYTLDRLAALVWGVADELELGDVVLSGHSWGGAVAVAAAASRPERTRGLVLFDSGHCDYRDWPGADLTATRDDMVAAARADSVDSWEALHAELRDAGLDQEWVMPAWHEAVEELGDGHIRLRVDPAARGEALYELTHATPSSAWPAIAEAGIPTLLVLATQPAAVAEANEALLPRFVAAVPQVDVVRPGCRHQVFADLGPRSGELVAEWLGSHLERYEQHGRHAERDADR